MGGAREPVSSSVSLWVRVPQILRGPLYLPGMACGATPCQLEAGHGLCPIGSSQFPPELQLCHPGAPALL